MSFEFRFQNRGPEVEFSGRFVIEKTSVLPVNLSALYDEKLATRAVNMEYTG
jgi:hypothetical protein